MSGYAAVSTAFRPPRKCSTVGEGSVTFGVREATDLRKAKSSTKMPCGRPSLPVTASVGGAWSLVPSAVWKRTAILAGTRATLSSFRRKSRCHELRLNSPSVMELSPIASCRRTTSRIASSWMRRSASAAIFPSATALRASTSTAGRIRLPTWSARNGGTVRAAIWGGLRRGGGNGAGPDQTPRRR